MSEGETWESCHLAAVLAEARLTDDMIRHRTFTGEVWADLDIGGLECSYVVFDGCRFTNCDFAGTAFYNAAFRNCCMSECRFRGTYWKTCGIHGTKGDGCDFRKSRFKSCSVSSTLLRYSNFSEGVWEKTSFTDCNLRESFLSGMRLSGLELGRVDFSGADFFQTVLKEIDLSSCVIDGIIVSESLRELKGATIDAAQATVLAKLLGVKLV